MRIGASLRLGVWMMAGCVWGASEADQAMVRIMRRQSEDGEAVRLLRRVQVDPDLDLVVLYKGYSYGHWVSMNGYAPTHLGLFLQHRDNPSMIYKIAVERGDEYRYSCSGSLVRVTATDVVIQCSGFKDYAGQNRKYVIDVRSKSLVKAVSYDRFYMERIVKMGERTTLTGTDGKRSMAIEYDPAGDAPFRIRHGLVAPKAKPLPALPKVKLPQSTWAEFEAARPDYKKHFRHAPEAVQESVGPRQVVDGVLWFGKQFPELGGSGVGGFGYFDAGKRAYRIFSPPEIRDWSATAIWVEADAVWLGLARWGEWLPSGKQLLRFDRATEKVTLFDMPEVVLDIARVGGQLVMATEYGAAILDGNKVRRFLLDQTTDGRWRVVEASERPPGS